jgi:hypothetical protein
MTPRPSIVQRHGRRALALVVLFFLYGMARLPSISSGERHELASRFRFTRAALPELDLPRHSVRRVHPSLERIAAWISSVGASVALNDLDGDGLPNDVAYVDTRIDRVVVAPVPGTPPRYAPFALDPTPLPYDSERTAPMGCLPGDVNEDGWMDIVVYFWGRTPIAFLRDPAGGPLDPSAYTSAEVVDTGERWYTNAATFADVDGDGHDDLVIGNYFQDDSGILDPDGEGRVRMQHSMSRAHNAGRNRILLWDGGKSGPAFFREAGGLDDTVAHGWALAVGAADLDGDLLPEIYFAHDFGPDRLLHNLSTPGHPRFAVLHGRKTLTTPNSKVLGKDSFKGMGCDFGDLNGDGLLDIYVSNIAAEYMLEESHFAFVSTGRLDEMKEGIAPYQDRSEELGLSRSGWGWESRLADFDNDGVLEAVQATGFVKGRLNRWPELHELAIGNDEMVTNTHIWPRFRPGDDLSGHQHNPFFVRASNGRYVDLAKELGIDSDQVTRGIATADVDGDGDLDFAVGNQWETSYFYRNDAPAPGAFLGLHLLLPLEHGSTVVRDGHPGGGNLRGRPAIGASARVTRSDGRVLVGQVDGGNGHSGKRSPDLHFGLGDDRAAGVKVELRWRDPSGAVRAEQLELEPGWHTVLLGWPEGGVL